MPNKWISFVLEYSKTNNISYRDALKDENVKKQYHNQSIKGKGIKKMKLLELFKGTGSVGKVAKKMNLDVISLDLEPIYTPDIEINILKWDYKSFVKENNFIPDFIWASPPCNTYSPLAYPLKERNTKTAEPYSDRAKLGTKILYKTIEIIEYFKQLNPNLLFCIENPRGMMRQDKKIKKYLRETTTYCSYGDYKYKPTDFFTNFELVLKDIGSGKKCENTILVENIRKIEDRYRMPPTLIKTILKQMINNYKK